MTLGRKEAPLEKQQGGRTLAVFIMAVVLEGDVGRSGGMRSMTPSVKRQIG